MGDDRSYRQISAKSGSTGGTGGELSGPIGAELGEPGGVLMFAPLGVQEAGGGLVGVAQGAGWTRGPLALRQEAATNDRDM
jgi:hypothetical protein